MPFLRQCRNLVNGQHPTTYCAYVSINREPDAVVSAARADVETGAA
jgi:hypothetical protein